MRYFVAILLFFGCLYNANSQVIVGQTVQGIILNDDNKKPLADATIININKAAGANTDAKGNFEIEASVNDTLHISLLGFQPLRVKVTNDWIKNRTTQLRLTEKAIALEEVVVRPFYLTGYLEVDLKLIPLKQNSYRYNIQGLSYGYEAGQYAPEALGNTMSSIFNPADKLYSFFGKKPKQLNRLKEMKKDESIRKLMESKYDRETISMLLGIDKIQIADILERCNYSEAFIQTANDLQVMDAINGCYEEYKVLKKK